jgi:hypothetical protein
MWPGKSLKHTVFYMCPTPVRRVWYKVPNTLYPAFSAALHVATHRGTPQSIYTKQQWFVTYPYPW